MKKILLTCSVLTVLAITLYAAGFGMQEQRSGDSMVFRTGSSLVIEATVAPTLVRQIALGTPIAASGNYVVTTANMTNAAYTLATNALSPARNLTTTVTANGGNDTVGKLLVTGTDTAGKALTETIVPGSAGTNAFKTIASIVGKSWAKDTNTNAAVDTLVIGVGTKVGLPVALPSGTATVLTSVGTSLAVSPATAGNGTLSIPLSTVTPSGINGTNAVIAYPAY